MKKTGKITLLLVLLFALLLTGCGAKNEARSPRELSLAVLDTLQEKNFNPCDADYVENSFEFENVPDDYALYLGAEFGVEFGIFSFQGNAEARAAARAIEAYLSREEQAVRDLAALYPAAELSARLERYQGASVRIKGNTVAYFLLSETDRTAAEQVFVRTVGR